MDHREIIQRSLDYIENHLKADIRADELANAAGFSVFHYYRLFQAATGMPVMQYILRRRLLHAIYAVRCGQTGIEAALEFGFDTYSGFYKAFLREFGCTPSEFLKHCRAKQPRKLLLSEEEHMTVTHKKAAELLRHWGLENEPITDIYYAGTGEKNDNACYVGDAYVLKFTANLGKLKTNTELAKALESVGLCAAPPIPAKNGEEYIRDGELFCYLTKRLPGGQAVSGDFYSAGGTDKARFTGEIIGQLHLALQKIDIPVHDADLLKTLTEWALPKAKAILHLDDAFCAALLADFSALYPKLPRQIIHRDPNPGNILHAENTWGFIDFELSERNVRVYDPCYAATAILSETFSADTAMNPHQWLDIYRSILLGYDSVAKLTADERTAVPYVLFANQLICTAWFSEQTKYTEQFEVNKAMTAWLAAHFDELRL